MKFFIFYSFIHLYFIYIFYFKKVLSIYKLFLYIFIEYFCILNCLLIFCFENIK
jgi:hypothetical protein